MKKMRQQKDAEHTREHVRNENVSGKWRQEGKLDIIPVRAEISWTQRGKQAWKIWHSQDILKARQRETEKQQDT